MSLPYSLASLTEREAITDALYRVIEGFDKNDLELCKSGLSADAFAFKLDENPVQLDGIFAKVGPMDTIHTISNIRIDVKPGASTAALTCSAVAQHCPPGRGLETDGPKFLAGSLYNLELVKEGGSDGGWKITKWALKIKWRQGDPSIME